MSAHRESNDLLPLYRNMTLVRQVEMALAKMFADSEVPGFIHLSVGQEGISAGIASALLPQDTMTTNHRGHGHVLARGMDLEGFFKEIMGRAGGLCMGRGGSMHVADLSLGILGANGIVGAGIPIALGSAMAHAVRKTQGVAVSFFGDGAMAEGVLHETMNMAALWRMPLLLVCENNGWSEFSPTSRQFAAKLNVLAGAFGIAYTRVNGNDVEEVAQAAQKATAGARSGEGPQVLECITHRLRGHYEGDPQKYRNAAELTTATGECPIARLRATLLGMGCGVEQLEAEEAQISTRISAAITAARVDALPDFQAALNDVYTSEITQ